MKNFAKCVAIVVEVSIVGVISGCGTTNNTVAGKRSTTIINSEANAATNTNKTNVSAGTVQKSDARSNSSNYPNLDHTPHGLKQGESLIGGNPTAAAHVPSLPQSRYHTSIPTTVIHVQYAVTAPKLPTLPATVQMSLPKSLSHDLTAYYLPMYGGTGFYIVGLNGMKATGQVGADSSYNITLKNSSGTEIVVSSAGACQGCAVDAASMYFPGARKDSKDYGGYHGTYLEELPASIETLNSNVMVWSYIEASHDQLFGFAHYKPINHGEGSFMNEVFVGSVAEVQKMAPWVLQDTLIQHHIQY